MYMRTLIGLHHPQAKSDPLHIEYRDKLNELMKIGKEVNSNEIKDEIKKLIPSIYGLKGLPKETVYLETGSTSCREIALSRLRWVEKIISSAISGGFLTHGYIVPVVHLRLFNFSHDKEHVELAKQVIESIFPLLLINKDHFTIQANGNFLSITLLSGNKLINSVTLSWILHLVRNYKICDKINKGLLELGIEEFNLLLKGVEKSPTNGTKRLEMMMEAKRIVNGLSLLILNMEVLFDGHNPAWVYSIYPDALYEVMGDQSFAVTNSGVVSLMGNTLFKCPRNYYNKVLSKFPEWKRLDMPFNLKVTFQALEGK